MKRCFSLLAAAGLLAAVPVQAQNAKTIGARQAVPAGATWSPQSFPSAPAIGDISDFTGYLNYISADFSDGPGTIDVTTSDFVTTLIEPEPADLVAAAGFLNPADDLFYFVDNTLAFYSYQVNSGVFTPAGTLTGIDAAIEFPIGIQVNPTTGGVKLVTLACEANADGDYVQSVLYDLATTTFEASNPVELRDPNADGTEGNEGVCLISFSWDGGDEIYGADLVADDFVSVSGATGELVERIGDPSDKGFLEDINFIQSAAWNESNDSHYIFVLSRLDETNANIQGLVYVVGPDDQLVFGGFVDGNTPPNEVLAGSFPYLNVVDAAEAGPAGATVAIGAAIPNPAATSARVPFSIEAASDVTMTVFDVLGRKVSTIAEGAYAAGSHDATLDASALSPGTYVVRLQAGATVVTRTLSIAR